MKRNWWKDILMLAGAGLMILVCYFIHLTVFDSNSGRVELSSVSFSDCSGASPGADYDITRLIVRAERDGRGTTEEVMSLPHDLGELRTGRWDIMVDAYDSHGNFLATCSTEIEVSDDDIYDLKLAFELPPPAVDVPNGRLLRVDPYAPFSLTANYRPLIKGREYSYIWTFWPTDAESASTHVVDMHGESSLPSDAFWEIWDWYGGEASEFQYTVDVMSEDGTAEFSGRIAVVRH